MDIFLQKCLEFFYKYPPEIISGFTFLFCLLSIIIFAKSCGLYGLYIYNSISVCLANIQILHLTKYYFFDATIPLGTVIFTTTFFASGIITETYGKKAAQKGVLIYFLSYLFFSLSMLISLAHSPSNGIISKEFSGYIDKNYNALLQVFLPSVRILVASLVAFGASQLCDIWVFSKIKEFTKGRFLWFRQGSAMFFSSIIDHILFSYIAFYFFSDVKPPLEIFFKGYVIGSYIIRIIVIVLCSAATYYRKLYVKTT